MRRGPLLIPLVLLVMLLGACAARTGPGSGSGPGSGEPGPTGGPTGPAPTGTTPDPIALPGPVTVVRTGGIAGLRDTVVVRPDGGWRRTAAAGRGRDGAGTLTPAQLAELTALAGDPALAAEAGHSAVPGSCADTFAYSVRAGATVVGWVDCPGGPGQPVVAGKIVRLLFSATGG